MFYNSFDNIGLAKVLSFLKSHNEEYLSGQDLSDVLKISRVAVWKHIKTIKELGYQIETKQKLGYRLTNNTTRLLPWEVSEGLKTKKIGKKAYYFDEIDSTQNYAMELAKSNNEEGSIVIAEKQTRGKGRQQRRWESPKGGIWLSIVLKPNIETTVLSLIPIVIVVSLSNAIKKSTRIKTELKWPNDITIKTKKVSGIIIDASIESNRLEYIVVGIGINFDIDVKEIEDELSNTVNFYGVSSILQHNKNANKLKLVQTFFEELEKNLTRIEKGNTEYIIKNWTESSSTIGKKITTISNGKKISGTAEKIDKDGGLLVKTKKGTEKILAEDITHLR